MDERKHGTTLTQLFVVVVAVMFIAAVLPPLLAKDYDVENISTAHYKVRDIAQGVIDFYQDMGRWPNLDADGNPDLHALVSGIGDAAERVARLFGNSTIGQKVDLIDNHLAHNHPAGVGHYATEGERAWHGPYLSETGSDPWGSPYIVYMVALTEDYPEGAHKAIVFSPGPNGLVETPQILDRGTRFGGDDVGMAFFVRDDGSTFAEFGGDGV